MDDLLRAQLKAIREARGISRSLAAKRARIDERTWSTWETPSQSSSKRAPKPSALLNFFQRSCIDIPPAFKAYLNTLRNQVISISSFKGGVGKSPITINVAACLVSQGYAVAVVSNDIVFRHKRARDEQPPTGSLISQVDFYDEREFLARPDSQSMKVSASFDDLINRYDFVLLDINRNPEFTRRCADLVIAVLDSDCRQSINGAESFIAHLKSAKCRKPALNYYGLVTNCDLGGQSRELEEYFGDHIPISIQMENDFIAARRMHRAHREDILKEIRALDMPLLMTQLTAAHRSVIDAFYEGELHQGGYGYFHSVQDVAPDSHAAYEICRLTEELITYRL